jgi:hypothetical protein
MKWDDEIGVGAGGGQEGNEEGLSESSNIDRTQVNRSYFPSLQFLFFYKFKVSSAFFVPACLLLHTSISCLGQLFFVWNLYNKCLLFFDNLWDLDAIRAPMLRSKNPLSIATIFAARFTLFKIASWRDIL